MVQYENIREMPLGELLVYYNALKAICERLEFELKPLYNATGANDKLKWIELKNELDHSKIYFDVVLNAMKYKSFHGLEEYKPLKKEKSKPIAKKPVIVSERQKKTKKKEKE